MLQDMRSLSRNTVHERNLERIDAHTSLQWRASLGKAKDMQGAGRAVQLGDVLTAARTVWWGTGRSKACTCGAPVEDAFHRHRQCPRWHKYREAIRERGRWEWLEGCGLAHFMDNELQWRRAAWRKSFSQISDPDDQIELVFTDGSGSNPTRPLLRLCSWVVVHRGEIRAKGILPLGCTVCRAELVALRRAVQ